jgi:hypothetical protein
MNYMINVDLESANGGNDCKSALHDGLGPHFDLTVHALGCQVHGARVVDRPPTRYWDDNAGQGYPFAEVVERVRALRLKHPNGHARRCRKCDVHGNLPDWD